MPSKALWKEQILWALGMALVLSFGFYWIDWYNLDRFAQGTVFRGLGLPVDRWFSFRPGWVWIYMLYFPSLLTLLFLGPVRRERGTFRRVAAGIGLQFLVAFPCFFIPLRMDQWLFTPNTLSEHWVAWLYQIDPGFNIFPSLHVANTAFLAGVVGRFKPRLWAGAAWVFCGLIALSALYVKQHYFVDLPAGAALGYLCYRWSFSRAAAFLEPAPS